ncbi:MAG: hypothetical protein A2Z26_02635 [Deltaproteobacteria bacterium RBG_16_66_15]|nr:MAG: hypothetical protein A2X90_01410 [Deltaproteobacteria bacterium GWA2_65_63]OGP78529.1 MAG: hypothetical protein A2Z26_02635 [Deltaproteobacteria bacterium RBG_16_66_15]HAM32474.1 DUF429 domain-containing protein [Deltaproteobacteria bacterium]
MTIVSVDLAHSDYRNIGIVVMSRLSNGIACQFETPTKHTVPAPGLLGDLLDNLCAKHGARYLLMDGPQGWKDASNGHLHARLCERELNTPAKTGLPGIVKPANYAPFVVFSVAVYDALASRGWRRWPGVHNGDREGRFLVESFPLSAWRSLDLPILPAKSKASHEDIQERATALAGMFSLDLGREPGHDELQAIVAGLAGIAIEAGNYAGIAIAGRPPFLLDGTWREGFIVNPKVPISV